MISANQRYTKPAESVHDERNDKKTSKGATEEELWYKLLATKVEIK